MNSHLIRGFAALVAVLAAPLVQAQYDASAGNFNWIYAPYTAAGAAATPYGPPTVQGTASNQISNQSALPLTVLSNFQGFGQVAGSTSAKQVTPLPSYTYAATYPSNAVGVTAATVVLENSFVGGVFSSGVPRYSMGDVMTPPLVKEDGVTPAPAGYWRTKPVEPGEIILNTVNGVATPVTPVTAYSVNVTSSNTDSTQVTVASVPSGLVVGASMLGQPITAITGTIVTLAGKANQAISSSLSVVVTPAMSYYYSPHAEQVYASQPGRVQITWVSLATLPPPAVAGTYGILTETFSVSSNTAAKVRTIYWTEGGLDGPPVSIVDSRITTINPIFNSSVPKAVAQEVVIPGHDPGGQANLTTLSYMKFGGLGQIHAYNVEGRILVEYLGNVRLGNNIYDSVGIDVVDIVRAPDINYVTTNLGKTVLPHDGDTSLVAYMPSSTQAETSSHCALDVQSNGFIQYIAEKTTGEPNSPDNGSPSSPDAYNKTAFYWLETGNYKMQWPKYLDHYWLRWSPNLSDYVHNTVDAAGSTATTGISFTADSLPSIVFQDDPAQVEAKIDATTQKLYVTLGGDQRNRSLLKFSNANATWYVNLYTQAETRSLALASASVTTNGVTTVTVSSTMGLEVGMTVTGTGISGTATIGSILDGTHYTLNPVVATNLPTIPNQSFEQNVAPTYSSSANDIPGWTFTGAHGVNDSNGPFADNGSIPDGKNVAFWQGSGSATTTVTGLVAGNSYDIQFSVNKRLLIGANTVNYAVSVDGISKLSETVTTFGYQTKTVSFTATGTTASLVIATTTVGDASLLLDNLLIRQTLNYTVEEDFSAAINGTATVGTRLVPPTGHENAGYISGGTNYYPAGYLDPTRVGVAAANAGAIIPVNAVPSKNTLTVRWYKKTAAPNANFKDFYVPGKIGRYTVSYPTAPSQIVIAQGVGTNDLPGPEAAGSVYVQNDSAAVGYNPNEEHAFMLGGRAYALREDLNIYSNSLVTQPASVWSSTNTSGYLAAKYTSEPYVLVAYTDSTDQRPAIHAYQVLRSNSSWPLDYTATAGTLLVKPYPLPLLPLAMVGTGTARVAKDVEVLTAVDAPTNTQLTSDPAYSSFTFQDRKGFPWVHRGPHTDPIVVSSTSTGGSTVTVASTTGLVPGMAVSGTGITGYASIVSINTSNKTLVLSQSTTASAQSWAYSPALTMKLYYLSQSGFFIPGAAITQPAAGTVLPFLRAAARSGLPLNTNSIDASATDSTQDQIDAPLAITYHPAWPTDAPELRVGETLALPKFGLPQVRGQKSAQVLYQQSVAKDTSNSLTKNSVTLFDPTREKTVAIDAAGLTQLPSSIATSLYQGKTYFQKLPPDLIQRFYFDPTRGAKGTLVLKGVFHDEAASEDYLDLNVLTPTQETAINSLETTTGADHTAWLKAIKSLKTTVQTFVENKSKLGTYMVDTVDTLPVDVYAASDNASIQTVTSVRHRRSRYTNSYYVTTKTTYTNAPVIAAIEENDTAVDSYALAATGQGTGYVTMVFGNGNAFTPIGDPVQVKVIKVNNQLYSGDLKLISSSNPLDEQVTLRHSADFAGKPDDYEFDWRWSTGEASAPAIYSTVMTPRIGDATVTNSNQWTYVSDPGAMLPTAQQYTQLSKPLTITSTASLCVNPRSYFKDSYGQPTNSFDLVPIDVSGSTVTVTNVGQLMVGMSVSGNGITGLASILSIKDATHLVLSQSPADKSTLTFTAASSMMSSFALTPSAVSGTSITVSSTAMMAADMRVTWAGINGTATIASVTDSTHLVLSQAPPTATSLTFNPVSYTDAEIAAGYPGLVLNSNTGVNFSSAGVPSKIVFSASLGDYDGCVLYINHKAALAYNAPSPQFTSIGASSGLTPNGLALQFAVDPSYFSAGPNTVEVAVYTTNDTNAMSALNFKLEASLETDMVTSAVSAWQTPGDYDATKGCDSINTNMAIIGGSSSNPFGGPQFVLNDRWFTMRYRPKASAGNVLGTPWSRWVAPQFTEGWVKRVLAAINPFEQRVKNLSTTAVNTDVSMLTQAGSKWEGDLALNMDNISDAGLIGIYETVLNRAKSMSIDANVNDPDTNNALLLAAGYLNDLYTILGNEAFADAANPTISLDSGAVNTSRFSFEGQVASSLDEEMALLRGRDDLLSPGVSTSPAYNRLYWNYTHGINSGEAIYATNYNIQEKAGSPTANGVLDEADAQRMYPQGHGDAYGHYLTALTGYYRLLWNKNFTWTPSAEAVTVLGVPVTVDFQDERKFAAAANNVAKSAEQICALIYRQSYKDDPASGWTQFRDNTPKNTQTDVKRAWGLDETVSRSAQGALVHWAMANAILPDVDNYHTGIQKIDRTTVPELGALVTTARSFQSTLDNAYARLNPLGLSSGAVPFDINPRLANSSQFSQYYDRALASLNNAAGAFNQAAVMTKSLRDQDTTLDAYTATISTQETAYVNQLIDIYGRPYSGDIGAGQLYPQGYVGPDLNHWFIVDRPNDLVDTNKAFSITLKDANNIQRFTGDKIDNIVNGYNKGTAVTTHTVNVVPSQWVQYNDVWSSTLGSRPITGSLQDALQAAQQSYLALAQANLALQKLTADMNHKGQVFYDNVKYHQAVDGVTAVANAATMALAYTEAIYKRQASEVAKVRAFLQAQTDAVTEACPKVIGVDNDATAPARGAFKAQNALATAIGGAVQQGFAWGESLAGLLGKGVGVSLSQTVTALNFGQDEVQKAMEYDTAYREVTTQAKTLMTLTIANQLALQNVNNVITKGIRLQAEREVFRLRAAAIIQGYRTNDLTFRTFRNEALEQYRSLYDLGSRYTYLAAKAYDYETGLLGSPQGQTVFSKIVASRSLGDLTGGVPRSTVSSLGDAGLAGTMAKLNADFSVAASRLGINNPDNYNTVFSLRQELFRIQDDPSITSDDDAWMQTLEQHIVSNVLNDSDVATQCLNIKKPDGSAVPGIIIPFSSTIESGKNFFGLELLGGDHVYSPSNYATRISNVGVILPGYVGMDASIGGPTLNSANKSFILSATPYVYLIPCGNDVMRAPPLGDTDTIRSWTIQDQAMPLPYNLGASDFNSTQFFGANSTLSSQPWVIRKHQAFRAVAEEGLFKGSAPLEYSSSRLIGRSVWNTRWKIVIPAINLLTDEPTALNRFVGSVTDVQLYLRTYSHAGN